MKKNEKIKYNPSYSKSELELLVRNLSEALSSALGPLQCFSGTSGISANEIGDNEAKYIQEFLGFLDLVKLVEEEELSDAVRLARQACWEVEKASQSDASKPTHPWADCGGGGYYENTVFYATDYGWLEFSEYDYDSDARRVLEHSRRSKEPPRNSDRDEFDDF